MRIKIKKMHPDAKMPIKLGDSSDFCFDVYAVNDGEWLNEKVVKYDIGIAFEIVRDAEPLDVANNINLKESPLLLSIDGRPRSSVWKTGLSLSNCEGTIDEAYRGNVSFVFYDVVPELPKYKKGDRIGQIKVGFTVPIEFEWSNDLTETKRGSGGYGSTGK